MKIIVVIHFLSLKIDFQVFLLVIYTILFSTRERYRPPTKTGHYSVCPTTFLYSAICIEPLTQTVDLYRCLFTRDVQSVDITVFIQIFYRVYYFFVFKTLNFFKFIIINSNIITMKCINILYKILYKHIIYI